MRAEGTWAAAAERRRPSTTCDYRKLGPRATGFFKVLRSCDFPSAGYAGDSVGDRAGTNRSRCRDLLRRQWPTGGAFAFRPKRVSAAMPALQTTKRRGAGIGGVIPRPEESLPRAPVLAVPLPWDPGRLCPRPNAYVTADSKQNSCAEFDATISHST